VYSTMVDRIYTDDVIEPDRYDFLSIVFHWATLLLIGLLFWSASAHEGAQDGDTAARLLELHRSVGVIIWLLTLLRLAWKASGGHVPALPATTGKLQAIGARGTQWAMYALLIAQPLSGLLQSIWRGKAFPLLLGELPPLVPRDKALMHLAHDMHEWGAQLFIAFIAVHVLAGLFHGLVRRDGVLGSMLPFPPTARCRNQG